MSISEEEARRIAVEAAKIALAAKPTPSTVTMEQAAEMLSLSTRQVRRLKLKSLGRGKVSYEAVVEAKAAR